MVDAGLEALAFGHDAVESAYYLQARSNSSIDFERLSVLREEARASKSKEPQVVAIGGMEFLLEPNGSKSGYPFILSNREFSTSALIHSPSGLSLAVLGSRRLK
jgi:hypothetical protein